MLQQRARGRRPGQSALRGSGSAETKAATKTTELIAYLGVLVAIIITATLVGDGGVENGADLFDARQAIEYITYLTMAYLVARGLAKSGSREHYTA